MLDLDNELFAIKDDTFGNSGIQIIWDSGAKFYAGDGSNKYFKFDGTNISWKGVNTELTAAGAFTASNATLTGGTVGGWTLSSTTLANGTNIILDSSNKKISIKNATFGNEGIQLEYNAGTPRFYVGDGSNEYLKYIQGTGLSLSTAQANAITIKSGGDIKIEAGGDIVLGGNDTAPGKIIFDGSSNDLSLYCDAGGTNSYMVPASGTGSPRLYIGHTTEGSFYQVMVEAYDTSYLRAYYDSSNIAQFFADADAGGSPHCGMYVKNGETPYTVQLRDSTPAYFGVIRT